MPTSTADESTRPTSSPREHIATSVSAAVERGAAALYKATAPLYGTAWHRRSHLFQGIYRKRSAVVLTAAVDVVELAQAIAVLDPNRTLSPGALAEGLHRYLLGGES